jgi:hypothetical protein
MKTTKVRGLILSLLCVLSLVAMTDAQARPTGPAEATQKLKIKLKFKHHGSGMHCDTPLGICLVINFRLATEPLTEEEVADGYGTADFVVEGDSLRMVFDREAALPDGTIRIDYDKALDPEVSRSFGYESITLKTGVYWVDWSRERYGELVVPIVKGGSIR